MSGTVRAGNIVNLGCVVLNRELLPLGGEPRTIIVTGQARSGTSLLSSALLLSGVYMGETDNTVVEDREISHYLEENMILDLYSKIQERNLQHNTWGFKRPNLFKSLVPTQLHMFRNPILIVSFRDSVAAIERARMSEVMDAKKLVEGYYRDSVLLLEFILRVRVPTLLVSYEKISANIKEVLPIVFDFCGVQHETTSMEHIIQGLASAQGRYMLNARAVYMGNVDGIKDGKLRGWACRVGWKEPISVEIGVNEKLVSVAKADEFRADLLESGIGEGNHSFSCDISEFIKDLDAILTVKAQGREFHLNRSGKTIRELLR